jgi:putative cardiolipin synthase
LFDIFWNGPDAIPIAALRPMPDFEGMLEEKRTLLREHRERMRTSAYSEAVRSSELVQQFKSKSVEWVFARGRVVGDLPEKTTKGAGATEDVTLAAQVQDEFYSARRELMISSPYFVPGKKATGRLCDLAASGVGVRILTNSFEATDVPIVHAGYSKYRKQLASGGVELFELRRRSAPESKREDDARAFGSANASLHAKSFVVDRERVFIGSLNLDPRSVVINTEVGVVIENEALAEAVARAMTALMHPQRSYRVAVSTEGKTTWIGEDADGNEVRITTEPETSWWDRFKIGFMRLMPIEGQI